MPPALAHDRSLLVELETHAKFTLDLYYDSPASTRNTRWRVSAGMICNPAAVAHCRRHRRYCAGQPASHLISARLRAICLVDGSSMWTETEPMDDPLLRRSVCIFKCFARRNSNDKCQKRSKLSVLKIASYSGCNRSRIVVELQPLDEPEVHSGALTVGDLIDRCYAIQEKSVVPPWLREEQVSITGSGMS